MAGRHIASLQTAKERPGRTAAVLGLLAILLVTVTVLALKGADPADAAAGVPEGTTLGRSGDITVTKAGTVIDAKAVYGYINVQADNVTITRTRVTYDGYHSVRIFPGADGTVIRDSEVVCTSSKTNGIVFGNYTAIRVMIKGCRNGFMYDSAAPATIIDSYWNGKLINVSAPANPPVAAPSPAPSVTQVPTATASPKPTATLAPPTTTPTTTPTAPATPTTAPVAPVAQGFPNGSTTGVPSGVSLTATGGMTITKDGTVVDAKHIKGTVLVRADDVTIKRSLIDSHGIYPVRVEPGSSGLVVEDSEIDGNGEASVAILYSNYTLNRVDIHDVRDGPRIEGANVTIKNSYIHHLTRVPGGHHDTIQVRSGSNILIQHNNLQAFNPVLNDPMNAALQVGSLSGPLNGLVLEANLMNGGNYTVSPGGSDVKGFVGRNNAFGRDYRYGVVRDIDPNDVWSGNYWLDTKVPVGA